MASDTSSPMPTRQRSRYRGGPPWGRAGQGRPSWWPENEPWPPERPPWQVNRRRVLFRVLLLFLAFVLLVGFAGWLSYHILGQGGEPDWQRGEGPPPIGPFIGLIVIIAIIVFVMRRIQA